MQSSVLNKWKEIFVWTPRLGGDIMNYPFHLRFSFNISAVIIIKQLHVLLACGTSLLIIYFNAVICFHIKDRLKPWKSICPQLLPIYSLQLTSFRYETLSVSKYQNRTEEHHSEMMHSSQIYWGNLSNKHVPDYCLAVWMKWWMLFIVWTCWNTTLKFVRSSQLFLSNVNVEFKSNFYLFKKSLDFKLNILGHITFSRFLSCES